MYGFVALLVLTGDAVGFVLGAGLLFGSALLTNFKGLRDRVPLVRSKNLFGKLSGWILLFFGGMIALGAVVPAVQPDDAALQDPIREARTGTDEDAVSPLLSSKVDSEDQVPDVPPTQPPEVAPTATDRPTETDVPPTTAPPTATVLPATATPVPPTIAPTEPPPPPPTDVPPQPTAVPPPPAPVPGVVVISYVYFDGAVSRTEDDEYAQITNQGGSPVNLAGWRLNAGDDGQDFRFPGFDLAPGQSCRVYTNEHHPESCGFSFGSGKALWNNKGDCGHLYDAQGQEVSSYCF